MNTFLISAALIAALVAVIGILIYLYGRSKQKLGETSSVKDGLQEAVDHAKRANEIEERNAALSDDELFKRLHENGDSK